MHHISLGFRHREDRNRPPLTASPTLNKEQVTDRPLPSTKPVQRAPSITDCFPNQGTVPEPRLRCSEPLCSGGYWNRTSDLFRVRDNFRAQHSPPLSTNTIRGRPPTSTQIRARCHAISQSANHPHTSGRLRTLRRHFQVHEESPSEVGGLVISRSRLLSTQTDTRSRTERSS